MTHININTVKAFFLGGFFLTLATACSEDHFEVQDISATSSKPLINNINNQENTKDFAKILQRTYVMKDQYDTKMGYTFADMLSRPAYYTVWAPVDGKYDAATILSQLDERDELLSTHPAPASPEFNKAWQINYQIANQFINNHIALYNHEASPAIQRVGMLNSKIYNFDVTARQLDHVSMQSEQIPASNGLLHILEGSVPFSYNIAEYLEYNSNFSEVQKIMFSPEYFSRNFNPNLSVPGAMNNEGQMVYVDSAYTVINKLDSRALIANEDSTYVAVVPSNAGWAEAYDKVSQIYKYGSAYAYNWDKSKHEFINTGGRSLRFNTDSLRQFSTNSKILTSTYFTTSRLPIANKKDSAEIVNYILNADSLISTNGVTFYNPNKGQTNLMFNGQQPVRLSNGYVYAVNKYNIEPSYSFVPHKNLINLIYDFNVIGTSGELTSIGNEPTYLGTRVHLTEEDINKEVKGKIPDNGYYRRFVVDGSNNMIVYIPLKGLYSTKYRIRAMILPNRINLADIQYDNSGNEIVENTQFTCAVYDDQGQSIKISKKIEIDPDTIQMYTLFDEIEIPKCYVGLPQGYDSFPTLRFTMTSRDQRKGKSKSLNIAYIIVEPIRPNVGADN